MTEAVTNVDTPFSWAKLETTPDPKLYRDTVDGLCLKIEGSAEIKICECQTDPNSCSNGVKNDYAATDIKENHITNITENHIRLAFEGKVPEKGKEGTLTENSVGSGPYAITNELEVKVGDVAKFEFFAEETTDYYELFAGLFSKSRGLVEYKFTRGASQQWEAFELPADEKDIYHVEFMLASYDKTGLGAIGAEMEIKNVMVTKASAAPTPMPTNEPTPAPTPMPTHEPTPAPTVPSDAAHKICVKNTEHRKTVKFKVKFGNKQIYKSKKIYKKDKEECVDIKNLADDLARLKVEITVVGGLQRGVPKKDKECKDGWAGNCKGWWVTKHSKGMVWTRNCKGWSTNWDC
jgi:hypothetical protein